MKVYFSDKMSLMVAYGYFYVEYYLLRLHLIKSLWKTFVLEYHMFHANKND